MYPGAGGAQKSVRVALQKMEFVWACAGLLDFAAIIIWSAHGCIFFNCLSQFSNFSMVASTLGLGMCC